jgi:putative heme-binding domain-containing protein
VQRRWTERIASEDPDSEQLLEDLAVLAIQPAKDSATMVLSILKRSKKPSVQMASMEYLSRIDTSEVAVGLLELLAAPWEPRVRDRMLAVLASRPTWAKKLLETIDQREISADAVPREVVQQLSSHNDSEIDSQVLKFWGRIATATAEERLAEVRRLHNDLRAGSGDVGRGKLLFREHCAACHQLFGEGGQLGPDLTSANRKDRDFLLVSIVDPSSIIRREYLSTVVQTKDDRVLTGIVKPDGDSRLLLHPQRGEPIALALSEIAQAKESATSLMPEDLYRQWSPQALRDLFAYLQSDPPVPP